MNKLSYEELLKEKGKFICSNVGVSMLPLLREGRDLIIIEPVNGRLKKYDVPLYRSKQGHYVLHRVIKVKENDYVILGDNCINKEYGITDDQIVGIMTSFVRRKKTISVTNGIYRLYSVFWCSIYPFRMVFKRLKAKLGRMIKG